MAVILLIVFLTTSLTLAFLVFTLMKIIKFKKEEVINLENNKKNEIRHIFAIMDGNRRWAKKNNLKVWVGHEYGTEAIKKTIDFCLDEKIPNLTLFAFAIDNFKRPTEELDYLFKKVAHKFFSDKERLESFLKEGIRTKFIGDSNLFPKELIKPLRRMEEATASCNKLNLNFLFCYGGQQEILQATKKISKEVEAGKIVPENITKEYFESFLWLPADPPPDIIIRTGKANRISNSTLYQSAYSEIYFLDCYWPEITPKHLKKIIKKYKKTKKNLGR